MQSSKSAWTNCTSRRMDLNLLGSGQCNRFPAAEPTTIRVFCVIGDNKATYLRQTMRGRSVHDLNE